MGPLDLATAGRHDATPLANAAMYCALRTKSRDWVALDKSAMPRRAAPLTGDIALRYAAA